MSRRDRAAQARMQRERLRRPGRARTEAREQTADEINEQIDNRDITADDVEMRRGEMRLSDDTRREMAAETLQGQFENVEPGADDIEVRDGRVTDESLQALTAQDVDPDLDQVDVTQDDIRVEDGQPQLRESVLQQQAAGDLDEQFDTTVTADTLEFDGTQPTDDAVAELLAADLDTQIDDMDIGPGDVDIEAGGLRQDVRDERVAQEIDGFDAGDIETETDGSLTRDSQRMIAAEQYDDAAGPSIDITEDDIGFIGGRPIISDWDLETRVLQRQAARDVSRELDGQGVNPDDIQLDGYNIDVEGTQQAMAATQLDREFADVDVSLDALDFQGGQVTQDSLQSVAAQQFDADISQREIAAGDVRASGGEIALQDDVAVSIARQDAAESLQEEFGQEVDPDRLDVDLDDGEVDLDDELELELAASQLDEQTGFDVTADDVDFDAETGEFVVEGPQAVDQPQLTQTLAMGQQLQARTAARDEQEPLGEMELGEIDALEDTVQPETGQFTATDVEIDSGSWSPTQPIRSTTGALADFGRDVQDEIIQPAAQGFGTGLEVSQTFTSPGLRRTEEVDIPSTTEEVLDGPSTTGGQLAASTAMGVGDVAVFPTQAPQAGVDVADFSADVVDIATGPGEGTQQDLAQSQIEADVGEPLPEEAIVQLDDGEFGIDQRFAAGLDLDEQPTVQPDESGIIDAARVTGGAARDLAVDTGAAVVDDPARTAGSLVGSTAVLGAAARGGSRTSLAAETAVQPEALAATGALRRAPGGERVFQAIPGSRVAPEEIALGTVGAAGTRAVSGARALRQADVPQFDLSPRQQAQLQDLSESAGFEFQGRDPTAVESAGPQLDTLFDPDVTSQMRTRDVQPEMQPTGQDVDGPLFGEPDAPRAQADDPPLFEDIQQAGDVRAFARGEERIGERILPEQVQQEFDLVREALGDDRGQSSLVAQGRQRQPERQRQQQDTGPELFEDFQQRQQQELDQLRELGSDIDRAQQPFQQRRQRGPRQAFEAQPRAVDTGPGFTDARLTGTQATGAAQPVDTVEGMLGAQGPFVGIGQESRQTPAEELFMTGRPTQEQTPDAFTQEFTQPATSMGVGARERQAAGPQTALDTQQVVSPARTQPEFGRQTGFDGLGRGRDRGRGRGRGRGRAADQDGEAFELFNESAPATEDTAIDWENPIAALGETGGRPETNGGDLPWL